MTAPITRQEIEALQANAAAALDAQDFDAWVACFASQGAYSVVTKENVDRGAELALIRCPSRGALADRVLAIRDMLYYTPRVQRRLQSGLRIVRREGATVYAESSFAVFESLPGQPSTLFVVGRYLDEVCREGESARFSRRTCVLDGDVVPSSMPFPV